MAFGGLGGPKYPLGTNFWDFVLKWQNISQEQNVIFITFITFSALIRDTSLFT